MCIRDSHWALLTGILPDHLNRYQNFEAYVQSKETIVAHQHPTDVTILPVDDPQAKRFAEKTRARIVWFGVFREGEERRGFGLFRVGDRVLLRTPEREGEVLPWGELAGQGEHTKRNLLAGALLALEMGASLDDARSLLREFRGLENRLEIIRGKDRTFVNDTAATIPEAVSAALRSFPEHQIVLITGGTDKNLDYQGLAGALQHTPNLRAVIFLEGSATDKLLSALEGSPLVQGSPKVRTMPAAVEQAQAASRAGDVILLSPGAASFELFRDEFDRGQQFRDAVAEIQENRRPR